MLDWKEKKPKPENKLDYTVFLIGDVGAPSLDKQEPSLKLMKKQMQEAGAQSATIFLGDNVYHNGLPEPGRYDREVSEKRLNEQLDVLKGYPGEKYMIPGNHDWNHSGRGGIEFVVREQNYVNDYLTEEGIVVGGDFYVPGDGCPGPYEVKISDDLVLIAIDSEWWLHPFDRPYGTGSNCWASTEVDFLVKLEDIIEKHQGTNILVVAHHPLFTRGNHGGFFTLTDHIFPLTMLRNWMYLPLPVLGSIYPFARKYGGILQDIPHPRYQAYIEGLLNIFDKYDNIVYAAGHEHSLQHFKHNKLSHIVSGSGCKIQHVRPGGNAMYTQEIKGFAKLMYYENGEAWVEYWVPEGDGSEGKMTFRTPLYDKEPRRKREAVVDNTNYADSTITVAANDNYLAKKGLHRKLLGEHYRQEWAAPVEVPLLDMKNELGGLTPYQKGGGKQTASLKIRNPDAREYTLRTVDKDPTMALPEYLRETAAQALLQDQVSAQHPYGALAIPRLADAAGIFHTNPKLVYIPQTPYLRQYRDEFSNTLAFLEEDADENHEEVASLGFAENLVGTDKVLRELQQDNDNKVDQKAYVRARLFDMLVGDWDRHEGQWRWKEEKTDSGKVYLPVPEDRDQVFFKADGLLPWLATRKWGLRNVQNFDYDYRDIVGLNLSALTIDRTFTSRVTRQEWLQMAEEIKASITDEVIDEAIGQWPENVQAISGEEIKSRLRSRRDKLPQAANAYYEHISKMVDVAGSDKHEQFVVNRLNDKETHLAVYKINKEGELRDTLYSRTFFTDETKELRLYGMHGKDKFEVTGDVKDGIVVRIIGGNDEDVITDKSSVAGLKKHTIVYDTKEGNTFTFGPETKDKTDISPDVNFYDRANYKLPYWGPRLSLEYNVDDGLFIGGGVLARTHKFRKNPYAAEHLLEANYAFYTNSFNVRYNGDIRQVIGKWNLGLHGAMQGPQYQRNFYGYGNDSRQQDSFDDSYYRVRFKRLSIATTLNNDLAPFFKIGVGPTYDRFKVVTSDTETFLENEAINGRLEPGTYDVAAGEFESQHYVGLMGFMNLDVLGEGNPKNPRIGMRSHSSISYNRQVDGEKLHYTNISSEFSFYLTPNFPIQLTWAGRLGAAHNFGDFRFYQANTLGGTENLRGYRRTRFAGRSYIFANAEARVQLFDFHLFLTPGKLGILGLYDAGRVYNDGDDNQGFFRHMHTGVGGGIWADIMNKNLISLTYAKGDVDRLWALNFGFLF
ncbi:BamA/TamA family outer membrane protein [Pontibacter sp. HJ8]